MTVLALLTTAAIPPLAGAQEGGGDLPCEIFRKPACQPNNDPPIVPYRPGQGCEDDDQCVDEVPETTCDLGISHCRDADGCLLPWECHTCPADPQIRCGGAQVPLPDRFGCISDQSECGCRIAVAPRCPEGRFPHQICGQDGVACYTGGCVDDPCPCVAEPQCRDDDVPLRNAQGCLTGECGPPHCADVDPAICECGFRAATDQDGCPSGNCEPEPAACPPTAVPDCQGAQVPGLAGREQLCLTGQCVVGLCFDGCDSDGDCASGDECRPYDGRCAVCQPRSCGGATPCPARTDCVEGHCQVRELPDPECAGGEEGACGDGGVCDDPGCGRCPEPCECDEDGDCPDGRICDCACVPGCRASEECVANQECDEDSRSCVEVVECDEPAACDDEQVCAAGLCVEDPGLCGDEAHQCSAMWDWRLLDWVCSEIELPECPVDNLGADCFAPVDAPRPSCICEEDGCRAARCGGPEQIACPSPAFRCSTLPPADAWDPWAPGVCREGRPHDRIRCRIDGDCVPEECAVATLCVNRDFVDCRSDLGGAPADNPAAIEGCLCIEGVCRSAQDEEDGENPEVHGEGEGEEGEGEGEEDEGEGAGEGDGEGEGESESESEDDGAGEVEAPGEGENGSEGEETAETPGEGSDGPGEGEEPVDGEIGDGASATPPALTRDRGGGCSCGQITASRWGRWNVRR